MAMPKQVEQQLKEVEELERALTAQPEAASDEPQQSDPVAEAQPAQEQPTEPVAEPVVEAKPVEDWEQKYRSLQGHFNAEVPRLHQQNKELASQLQAMQQQIADIQKPKQQPTDDRLVTDEDVSQYGADLIDLQRRVTREVVREFVNPLKEELAQRDAKINQLETMLGKTGGDVATLSFEQRLERAIPDFPQLNADPKWIAWLDAVDDYTGEPRRAYAEYIYNQGNVDKLKQIVGFYKKATGQQAQDQQRQQRKTELERQTQPTRTASASSVPAGERIYTEAEFNRLWNKVRELYAKGQNDEANQLDIELTQATMQGRVRA